MHHHGASGSIREHHEASCIIMEHQEASWSIREHHGTSGSIMEHQEASGSIVGHHGASRSIREHLFISVRLQPAVRCHDAKNTSFGFRGWLVVGWKMGKCLWWFSQSPELERWEPGLKVWCGRGSRGFEPVPRPMTLDPASVVPSKVGHDPITTTGINDFFIPCSALRTRRLPCKKNQGSGGGRFPNASERGTSRFWGRMRRASCWWRRNLHVSGGAIGTCRRIQPWRPTQPRCIRHGRPESRSYIDWSTNQSALEKEWNLLESKLAVRAAHLVYKGVGSEPKD